MIEASNNGIILVRTQVVTKVGTEQGQLLPVPAFVVQEVVQESISRDYESTATTTIKSLKW